MDGRREAPSDWAEEDPGLPIEFGPASNAEYDPEPVLPRFFRKRSGAPTTTRNATPDGSA